MFRRWIYVALLLMLPSLAHAQSCTPNNNSNFTISGNTLSSTAPLTQGTYSVGITPSVTGTSNSGTACFLVTVTSTAQASGTCMFGSVCPSGPAWSLVFNDEFTANGTVGTFSGDGLNWAVPDNSASSKTCATVTYNQWCMDYLDGNTNYSFGNTPISDCQNQIVVSGGYLHIITTGAGTGFGCEIDQYVSLSPLSSTGGTYFETRSNYDNSGNWPDLNWTCCAGRSGGEAYIEVDVLEFGYKAAFFTSNGIFVVHDGYPGPGTGWHLGGIQFEATVGVRLFWDGVVVPDQGSGLTQDANGFYNPDGCSASTPCNQSTLIRFIDENKSTSNSTGLLADWFREYAHP